MTPPKSAHNPNKMSPLVEALVSGEKNNKQGGILVNDPNGLCLLSKGTLANSNGEDQSGIYTSLTKLARSLTPMTENPNETPLITLELEDQGAILIKEYDGHTVAMKVPNRSMEAEDSEGQE